MSDNVYPILDNERSSFGPGTITTDKGITKRELFAAMAMQGLLSNPNKLTDHWKTWNADNYAEDAVLLADVLLEALSKKENK